MADENIENEAVDAAAITDGEATEGASDEAAPAEASSGEQETEGTPESAEVETPNTDEGEGEGTGDGEPAERKTLAEVVEENRRKAAEAAKAESGEEPPESDTETGAENGDGEKKPGEDPDAKKDELKVDEVDKVHANDSVSARERIKQLATLRDELKAELDPLKETFELLGGQEGVDQLLGKIEVLEDPAKAADFVAMVEAAPNFEEFKQKHFWQELDNPANQQMIIEDKFGEGYTMDRLVRLVEAEKAGLIDLDEIAGRSDEFRLSEDELNAKRGERAEIEKLRKELEELKKPSAEAAKEKHLAEVNQRWDEFGKGYDAELFPMLEEFGVLPVQDDPPEVVQAKARHWKDVIERAQAAFLKDPLFTEIGKMIEAGATDTITFKNKARRFKPVYLDVTKKEIMKELPFLHGTLDAVSKQSRAKGATAPQKANSENQNPPKATPKDAPAADAAQRMQTAAPAEKKGPDLRDEQERKTAFQRAVERSAAARRG